ncbi:MAG: excinuclease ABC subunit UvrC, partial [Firmicutes bacterium]|nr:excinuclease ABC subunit UvrC [Bacillota bacterium]
MRDGPPGGGNRGSLPWSNQGDTKPSALEVERRSNNQPMNQPDNQSEERLREKLEEKLRHIPNRPGVYMMKGAGGEVLYVGKAASLKHRVRSYFQSRRAFPPKLHAMVSDVLDIEYIVTASEVEALILESNLIKAHAPWYNVRLKDDKAYPYLRVSRDEKYPKVSIVRRMKKDGARYFGPYTRTTPMRETIRFLRKLFPIRSCTKELDGTPEGRPCLNFHIERCLGPCTGKVSEEAYREMMDQVCLFLEGRLEKLIPDLERKMLEAAGNLQFEQAARLRNRVRALSGVVEQQKAVAPPGDDLDVAGMARHGELACAQVFQVRGGKLVGRDHFLLETAPGTGDQEIMTAFVERHYEGAAFVPPLILIQTEVDDAPVVQAWLEGRRGGRVVLRVPKRGEGRRLISMAGENASLVLEEHLSEASRKEAETRRGLEELAHALQLSKLPFRIEAFDISNIQGNDAVGSMVVFEDGEPRRSEYKRFKIRLAKGPDDYAMMREVVRRRFLRALREREEVGWAEECSRVDECGRFEGRSKVVPDGRTSVEDGAPDADAGMPAEGAGMPDADAGTPEVDAGTPHEGAGAPDADVGAPAGHQREDLPRERPQKEGGFGVLPDLVLVD